MAIVLPFTLSWFMQIREEISKSDAVSEANSLLKDYGNNSKEALALLGRNGFYTSIFNELIDAFGNEDQSSVFQERQIDATAPPPLQYPMQL